MRRPREDGGVIRAGYDDALDEVRTLARDGQRLIVELETRLREEVQIATFEVALYPRVRL